MDSPAMPAPPQHLRSLTSGISDPHPSRECIHEFVTLAYRLAKAYVHSSRNSGVVESIIFRNQSDDLALDLIADLFERDRDGRFIRIATFFADTNFQKLSDAGLWAETRSLILGQINDALFALYGDADRSLSRIIRNIKRASGRIEDVTVDRRATGLVLVVSSESSHRPRITYEELECVIAPSIGDPFHLEDIIRSTCRSVRLSGRWYPEIHLTQFALCLRNARVRQYIPVNNRATSGNRLGRQDAAGLIRRSVRRIRKEKMDFYVRTERLTAVEFEHVVSAIELRFLTMSDLDERPISSNFEAIAEIIPDLTESVYRDRYRNIFEYLFQLSRDQLVELLGREGIVSAART